MNHHLETHHVDQRDSSFHVDNCVDQNKNKAVLAYMLCGQDKNRFAMAYLAWRFLVGPNKSVELTFMCVGNMGCFVEAGVWLLEAKTTRY